MARVSTLIIQATDDDAIDVSELPLSRSFSLRVGAALSLHYPNLVALEKALDEAMHQVMLHKQRLKDAAVDDRAYDLAVGL